jgi:hypothetical protein
MTNQTEQDLWTLGHCLHSNCGVDMIEISSDGVNIIVRVKEYSKDAARSKVMDFSKSLDFIEHRIPLKGIKNEN